MKCKLIKLEKEKLKAETAASDERIRRAVVTLSAHDRGRNVLCDLRQLTTGMAAGLDSEGRDALDMLLTEWQEGRTAFTYELPSVVSPMQRPGSVRCEGWRRTSIFQMGGTGRWEQCKAQGIVRLKFKDADSGKVKTLPACKECWAECLTSGITIIEARPIVDSDQAH